MNQNVFSHSRTFAVSVFLFPPQSGTKSRSTLPIQRNMDGLYPRFFKSEVEGCCVFFCHLINLSCSTCCPAFSAWVVTVGSSHQNVLKFGRPRSRELDQTVSNLLMSMNALSLKWSIYVPLGTTRWCSYDRCRHTARTGLSVVGFAWSHCVRVGSFQVLRRSLAVQRHVHQVN